MKKYTTITNRKDFPIAGYRVSEGNMHRSYCSCGFDTCDILMNCPICGNTQWTTKYDKTKTYKVHLNGLYTTIEETTSWITMDYNNLPATVLVQKNSSVNHDLWTAPKPLEVFIEEFPELLTIPELRLAYDILDKNGKLSSNEGWYYAPNKKWQVVSAFASKCIKEHKGYAPKIAEQLIDVIGNYDLISKLEQVTRRTKPIKDIMFDLQNLKPHVQVYMRATPIFEKLITYPNAYDSIDNEVGEFIAAYYSEGYISYLQALLPLLTDVKFTPDQRRMFIKWMKEKFHLLSYGSCSEVSDVLDWIQNNSFDNTKEYYMLRNRERFTKYFDAVKYDNAMLDFYQNPADAIIKLSQIK